MKWQDTKIPKVTFSVLGVSYCQLSCVIIKWTVRAIVIAIVIVARLIWVMGSQTTRVV